MKFKIIIAFILCLYFFPVIFGSSVFFCGDTITIFYPLKTEFIQSILKGVFPLWNPYIHSGYPSYADISLGLYYPPNYILLLSQSIKMISLLVIFHFFVAAFFMYILSRKLHLSEIASITSAVVFSLSGIMVDYIAELPRLSTISLYPLFYLALINLLEKPKTSFKTFSNTMRMGDGRREGFRWPGSPLRVAMGLLSGRTQSGKCLETDSMIKASVFLSLVLLSFSFLLKAK